MGDFSGLGAASGAASGAQAGTMIMPGWGTAIGGGLGLLAGGFLGGGDDEGSLLEGFDIPEFEEDADYRETQDYLKSLGINVLEGDIPDYYAPIGERGGKEFEDVLNLMSGDIKKASLESAAAMGRGGGAASQIAAEQVGRFSTKARYDDFLRAMGGRETLFKQGRGITENVRTAGQNQQQQKNSFALGASGLELQKLMGLDTYNMKQDAIEGEAWGEAMGTGMDVLGEMDWDKMLNKTTSASAMAKTSHLGAVTGAAKSGALSFL